MVAARTRWDALASWLIYLRTMGIFCVVWYALSRAVPNKLLLPSPAEVVLALRDAALDGDLLGNTEASLWRLAVSLLVAALLAIPLGLAIGRSRVWEDIFEVPVEVLRPIAGIAWIPLALFVLGIGNALPVFIMFYTAFFPLLIGTAAGARGVDRRLIAAAETMGLSRGALLRQVILPATVPAILVSSRLAVASSWTAVVAAELMGAPSGVGYAIEYYRSMLMTPSVMAFIAVIGLLGFLSDRLLRVLGRRLTPWAINGAAS